MKNITHLIYHRDADGFLSAIIADIFEYNKSKVEFHSINYGEDTNFINDLDNKIYILDFSLPMDQMYQLYKRLGNRLIWIDHHATAINAANNYKEDLSLIKGVRLSVDKDGIPRAACELTYYYLYNIFNQENFENMQHVDKFINRGIPYLVKCIGRWDTWRWAKNPENSHPRNLVSWINELPNNGDPAIIDNRKEIKDVLYNVNDQLLLAIKQGIKYQNKYIEKNAEIMKRFGYTGTFNDIPAILINSTNKGSELFHSMYNSDLHKLMVIYEEVKGLYWTISMYSEDPNIDCGSMCQMLGENCPDRTNINSTGGGHKGAAGFQTTGEHLRSLIKVDKQK